MAAGAIGLDLYAHHRTAGLAQTADRWGRLALLGALLWVANLYASPTHWWRVFESARLGVATAAVCAGAILMRRITSGEPLRLGGPMAALLFGYLAIIPLSLLWSIDPATTRRSVVDAAKLLVVFVAVQNALDSRARLRAFFAVASFASLAPALGGIRVWLDGERLVEGFRTHWYGVFADPNRLAMNLIVVMPMTFALAALTRRRWLKLAYLGIAAAQIASIVLTHSRSGAIAATLAAAAFLLRGDIRRLARGAVAAIVLAAGVAAFAPQSFWTRSSTIADFETDASVAGRQRAWQVLGVIWEERPLSGVGAGAFLRSWDAYAPLAAGGRHLVAHNVFMEILGELGIVALLAFFAFVALLLARLWIAGRDEAGGVEARVVFAALAGYMVMELVNGYSLSWWLYLLFSCAFAALRVQATRARLAAEGGVA
jgi:putative inorganic carbon (HCO3(-)) transporter